MVHSVTGGPECNRWYKHLYFAFGMCFSVKFSFFFKRYFPFFSTATTKTTFYFVCRNGHFPLSEIQT